MGTLKADLDTPGFKLVETHISYVFIGDTEVFKVKRPVNLGFLDFSTLAARLDACQAEVRLNGRLAPDVYMGVVPVTRSAGGLHEFSGQGEVVDWAVHMRRLQDGDRADVRLLEGRLTAQHIEELAKHIADFHARARCDEETKRHGMAESVRLNVQENFLQTRTHLDSYLTPSQAAEIERWQLAQLADERRFAERAESGRLRDGHGDLRLEHVYLRDDGTIDIIDCIEFNERFRYADVCSDIAFLSMDLVRQGRIDLAERFLAHYAEQSDDYDLYSVVNFYESYRAFVRGKVAALLAQDPEASSETRARAHREARRYFLLSLAFEREPLEQPRLIAVGGMIASGKSTVAAEAARLMSAPRLSSDRTRKRLLGKEPHESMQVDAWTGAYTREATNALYAELARRAEVVLESGRSVIVDASFRTRALRGAIRQLACRLDVPFTLIECVAPRETCL
ncbi:MAG: AAA family ATPase, partial [Myxococcota bacterium]